MMCNEDECYFSNLKLKGVPHGFGWQRDGDVSTNTIDNILCDINKEYGKLQHRVLELQRQYEALLEAALRNVK